jgi:hypothetical protein
MTEGFIFRDEAEAQAACEWWQKELRMLDWQCDVQIARHWEILPNCSADNGYNLAHETMTIRLLDPIDFHPQVGNKFDIQDHEMDLIHELGHGLFYPATDKTSDTQERALNAFAESAVRLRRLAYPEPPWRCK